MSTREPVGDRYVRTVVPIGEFLDRSGLNSGDVALLIEDGMIEAGYAADGAIRGVIIGDLPTPADLRARGMTPSSGYLPETFRYDADPDGANDEPIEDGDEVGGGPGWSFAWD